LVFLLCCTIYRRRLVKRLTEIFKEIWTFLKPYEPPAPLSTTPEKQIKGEAVQRFTRCTFCGCESFYEGPSGGAAQNIKCADCGARFNIGLVPGGPVLIDTLSGPEKKE
jgi:hypothetical protein